MFGRLLVPLDEEERLVIPAAAVRRVGQLDLVDVVEEPQPSQRLLRRRIVQLGERLGDRVEVLSGLRSGETVALPAEG
jgi:multidrug efflux pump subunit AcrA (membrane-fusion protein)